MLSIVFLQPLWECDMLISTITATAIQQIIMVDIVLLAAIVGTATSPNDISRQTNICIQTWCYILWVPGTQHVHAENHVVLVPPTSHVQPRSTQRKTTANSKTVGNPLWEVTLYSNSDTRLQGVGINFPKMELSFSGLPAVVLFCFWNGGEVWQPESAGAFLVMVTYPLHLKGQAIRDGSGHFSTSGH